MARPPHPTLIIGVLVLALSAPAGSAGAQEETVQVERIGGPTRYATAVAVTEAWLGDICAYEATFPTLPSGTEEECLENRPVGLNLSRADDFADALAIPTYLYTEHGPTLLTPPDRLPPEIDRLSPHFDGGGLIFGSEAVVSDDVANEVERRFGVVNRVAGPDRYATSAAAARFNAEIYVDAYGYEGNEVVEAMILVSGEDWPDALAASAITRLGVPIVLVRRDEIPEPVAELIRQYGSSGTQFVLVGGEAVISQAVVDQLRGLARGPVYRIAGSDRTATARAIADDYLAAPDPDERNTNGIILVRPDSFADAIAAPSLIHSRRAPIIIPATTTDLGAANIQWLTDNADRLDTVTVLGETDVVPDSIVEQAIDAICAGRNCIDR